MDSALSVRRGLSENRRLDENSGLCINNKKMVCWARIVSKTNIMDCVRIISLMKSVVK